MEQGNQDRDKLHMVQNTTTLTQSLVPFIVSVSAIKGFRLFSHDDGQSYIKSEDKLTTKLFLLPKNMDLQYFGLCKEEILELLKPIYVMTDAGDYWRVAVGHHAKQGLT